MTRPQPQPKSNTLAVSRLSTPRRDLKKASAPCSRSPMRLENGMTMPESDASLGQRTSEIQIADNRQRALVPIHPTKDPDTGVLGQGGVRPEERASLKLRPERWEMFR